VRVWAGMRRALEEEGWRSFDFLPDLIKGSLSRRPPPGGDLHSLGIAFHSLLLVISLLSLGL
jgi:hypothetical protein